MKLLALLLTLCMGACSCASIPSHTDLRATALRLEFAGGGVCSGTAISADTLVTAQHCLTGTLQRVNGVSVTVTGIGKDKKDLATVRVTGTSFKTWARFGPPLKQGDRIRFWGNAALLHDAYREGYVVSVTAEQVLIDAQAFGGDSGGGIFDSQGRVVGVVTGGYAWVARNGGVFQLVLVYPMESA